MALSLGTAQVAIKEEQVDYKDGGTTVKGVIVYVNYPEAVHAFTNPEATAIGKEFNLPLRYDAVADRQSKAEMLKFLSSLFGN